MRGQLPSRRRHVQLLAQPPLPRRRQEHLLHLLRRRRLGDALQVREAHQPHPGHGEARPRSLLRLHRARHLGLAARPVAPRGRHLVAEPECPPHLRGRQAPGHRSLPLAPPGHARPALHRRGLHPLPRPRGACQARRGGHLGQAARRPSRPPPLHARHTEQAALASGALGPAPIRQTHRHRQAHRPHAAGGAGAGPPTHANA